MKQKYSSTTSKTKDIHSKSPFRKITKYEGVIDYKIIREIHRKIQAIASTIQSDLVGGQYVLFGIAMQLSTYRTVIGQEFWHPVRPSQIAPVPTNTDAAEIPRYIQIHAVQVDQWRQMVNAEYVLKQQFLGSM